MKKIVVYSPDSNVCLSLFMYLQSDYNVTTTTDVSVLKTMTKHIKFDLLIMDAQPSNSVEAFCKEMKELHPEVPVILTYVYQDNHKIFDLNIRKYISSVFYKPFDLYEVSKYMTSLLI
jgi:DNA-binding NtrC family response regulator